jgi:CheY-like chemotaxis protein
MEMPGLDGIGLYRAVADRSPTLARRFIFITGSSHTPEVRAFVERTQVRLLSKPFNVDQLRRVVEEVLTA